MSNPQNPLPPLSAVADPAVRKALQAIYDELRLRRGETGSGDNKFVTKAELVTYVGQASPRS
jgi:hypothetical protein